MAPGRGLPRSPTGCRAGFIQASKVQTDVCHPAMFHQRK
jgi:hypothetical protein